ncbi:hypothetical protein GN244_ATG19842 [Phytophthora infestans]|uniref:Uncharacterized protein n=1 Tax=Phytophthora infestans TaxID=4787 RepID=A0A833VTX6_PHYIN|nr:hypothetical protein GN244_ATG19842 [Phytophthora infestans]
MSSKKPATAVTLAGILAARLTSADIPISVQHDATYSLSEFHGLPCSGEGPDPEGNSCPKAGDVATADCRPYLLSFNAHCVLIQSDVWGCSFLKKEYTSGVDSETTAAYGESMSSDGRGLGVLPDRGELDTLPGRRIFNTVSDQGRFDTSPDGGGLDAVFDRERNVALPYRKSRHVLPDEGGFDAVPNALPD